jgi:hypothetical protein
MWVGILLPAISITALLTPPGRWVLEEESGLWVFVLMGLVVSPWIYWPYCVKKFHDAIWLVAGYNHPVSPRRAVSLQLLPLANLYWSFYWPSQIAKFVNWRCQAHVMKGWIPGLLIVAAMVISGYLWAYGAVLLFAAGSYISRHMRRAFVAPPVPDHLRESISIHCVVYRRNP